MSQMRREIELEGSGLDIGESIGDLECPFCGGGRTGERKFSITRIDTGLLFNCYRASCSDGRGFIPTRGDLLHGPKPKTASKWKGPYRGEFRPLKRMDREYFANRFDLEHPYLDFIGVNEFGYYVLEVKTMDGYVRGYIVRRGCWGGNPACERNRATTGPKSRAYTSNSDDVLLSWHNPSKDDAKWTGRIIVVEDQISAAKVAQAGYTGVALTGSYLGQEKVIELARAKPTKLVIALDADATGEAFKAARRWGLAFPSIQVLPLQRDIKDMKRTDVEELLK